MPRTLAPLLLAASTLLCAAPALAGAQPAAVQEDRSGWDCTTQGNRVCGPDNPQRVQAGQYEAGKLVPWRGDTVPAWCKDICLGAQLD